MEKDTKMKRSQLRQASVICLYQHLLLNRDINKIALENLKIDLNNPVDANQKFIARLCLDSLANKEMLIEKIDDNLASDWHFKRLSLLEQAILLQSAAEILIHKLDKNIVIDEAINLSKKYCDETSYKFINAVLDKIND